MSQLKARKYDWRHKKERARVKKIVDAGSAFCARCGGAIFAGQPWDLGHDDDDPSRYSGPEHRHSRDCPAGGNRATAGRRAWKLANRARRRRVNPRFW